MSPLHTVEMASYNLFLELAKVIGATRMLELCELYIVRNRASQDASGARVWRDCSNTSIPQTWLNLNESPTSSPLLMPITPKKLEFQSPLFTASATLTPAPAGGFFLSEQ